MFVHQPNNVDQAFRFSIRNYEKKILRLKAPLDAPTEPGPWQDMPDNVSGEVETRDLSCSYWRYVSGVSDPDDAVDVTSDEQGQDESYPGAWLESDPVSSDPADGDVQYYEVGLTTLSMEALGSTVATLFGPPVPNRHGPEIEGAGASGFTWHVHGNLTFQALSETDTAAAAQLNDVILKIGYVPEELVERNTRNGTLQWQWKAYPSRAVLDSLPLLLTTSVHPGEWVDRGVGGLRISYADFTRDLVISSAQIVNGRAHVAYWLERASQRDRSFNTTYTGTYASTATSYWSNVADGPITSLYSIEDVNNGSQTNISSSSYQPGLCGYWEKLGDEVWLASAGSAPDARIMMSQSFVWGAIFSSRILSWTFSQISNNDFGVAVAALLGTSALVVTPDRIIARADGSTTVLATHSTAFSPGDRADVKVEFHGAWGDVNTPVTITVYRNNVQVSTITAPANYADAAAQYWVPAPWAAAANTGNRIASIAISTIPSNHGGIEVGAEMEFGPGSASTFEATGAVGARFRWLYPIGYPRVFFEPAGAYGGSGSWNDDGSVPLEAVMWVKLEVEPDVGELWFAWVSPDNLDNPTLDPYTQMRTGVTPDGNMYIRRFNGEIVGGDGQQFYGDTYGRPGNNPTPQFYDESRVIWEWRDDANGNPTRQPDGVQFLDRSYDYYAMFTLWGAGSETGSVWWDRDWDDLWFYLRPRGRLPSPRVWRWGPDDDHDGYQYEGYTHHPVPMQGPPSKLTEGVALLVADSYEDWDYCVRPAIIGWTPDRGPFSYGVLSEWSAQHGDFNSWSQDNYGEPSVSDATGSIFTSLIYGSAYNQIHAQLIVISYGDWSRYYDGSYGMVPTIAGEGGRYLGTDQVRWDVDATIGNAGLHPVTGPTDGRDTLRLNSGSASTTDYGSSDVTEVDMGGDIPGSQPVVHELGRTSFPGSGAGGLTLLDVGHDWQYVTVMVSGAVTGNFKFYMLYKDVNNYVSFEPSGSNPNIDRSSNSYYATPPYYLSMRVRINGVDNWIDTEDAGSTHGFNRYIVASANAETGSISFAMQNDGGSGAGGFFQWQGALPHGTKLGWDFGGSSATALQDWNGFNSFYGTAPAGSFSAGYLTPSFGAALGGVVVRWCISNALGETYYRISQDTVWRYQNGQLTQLAQFPLTHRLRIEPVDDTISIYDLDTHELLASVDAPLIPFSQMRPGYSYWGYQAGVWANRPSGDAVRIRKWRVTSSKFYNSAAQEGGRTDGYGWVALPGPQQFASSRGRTINGAEPWSTPIDTGFDTNPQLEIHQSTLDWVVWLPKYPDSVFVSVDRDEGVSYDPEHPELHQRVYECDKRTGNVIRTLPGFYAPAQYTPTGSFNAYTYYWAVASPDGTKIWCSSTAHNYATNQSAPALLEYDPETGEVSLVHRLPDDVDYLGQLPDGRELYTRGRRWNGRLMIYDPDADVELDVALEPYRGHGFNGGFLGWDGKWHVWFGQLNYHVDPGHYRLSAAEVAGTSVAPGTEVRVGNGGAKFFSEFYRFDLRLAGTVTGQNRVLNPNGQDIYNFNSGAAMTADVVFGNDITDVAIGNDQIFYEAVPDALRIVAHDSTQDIMSNYPDYYWDASLSYVPMDGNFSKFLTSVDIGGYGVGISAKVRVIQYGYDPYELSVLAIDESSWTPLFHNQGYLYDPDVINTSLSVMFPVKVQSKRAAGVDVVALQFIFKINDGYTDNDPVTAKPYVRLQNVSVAPNDGAVPIEYMFNLDPDQPQTYCEVVAPSYWDVQQGNDPPNNWDSQSGYGIEYQYPAMAFPAVFGVHPTDDTPNGQIVTWDYQRFHRVDLVTGKTIASSAFIFGDENMYAWGGVANRDANGDFWTYAGTDSPRLFGRLQWDGSRDGGTWSFHGPTTDDLVAQGFDTYSIYSTPTYVNGKLVALVWLNGSRQYVNGTWTYSYAYVAWNDDGSLAWQHVWQLSPEDLAADEADPGFELRSDDRYIYSTGEGHAVWAFDYVTHNQDPQRVIDLSDPNTYYERNADEVPDIELPGPIDNFDRNDSTTQIGPLSATNARYLTRGAGTVGIRNRHGYVVAAPTDGSFVIASVEPVTPTSGTIITMNAWSIEWTRTADEGAIVLLFDMRISGTSTFGHRLIMDRSSWVLQDLGGTSQPTSAREALTDVATGAVDIAMNLPHRIKFSYTNSVLNVWVSAPGRGTQHVIVNVDLDSQGGTWYGWGANTAGVDDFDNWVSRPDDRTDVDLQGVWIGDDGYVYAWGINDGYSLGSLNRNRLLAFRGARDGSSQARLAQGGMYALDNSGTQMARSYDGTGVVDGDNYWALNDHLNAVISRFDLNTGAFDEFAVVIDPAGEASWTPSALVCMWAPGQPQESGRWSVGSVPMDR